MVKHQFIGKPSSLCIQYFDTSKEPSAGVYQDRLRTMKIPYRKSFWLRRRQPKMLDIDGRLKSTEFHFHALLS